MPEDPRLLIDASITISQTSSPECLPNAFSSLFHALKQLPYRSWLTIPVTNTNTNAILFIQHLQQHTRTHTQPWPLTSPHPGDMLGCVDFGQMKGVRQAAGRQHVLQIGLTEAALHAVDPHRAVLAGEADAASVEHLPDRPPSILLCVCGGGGGMNTI